MSRNKLTAKEERVIVRMIREGHSQADVIRELKRSRDVIYDAAVRLGMNEDGLRTAAAAKVRTAYENRRKKEPDLPGWHDLDIDLRHDMFDKVYLEMKRNADRYRASIMKTTVTPESMYADIVEVRNQMKNALDNIDRLTAMIAEDMKK